jgi:hypothetical protein
MQGLSVLPKANHEACKSSMAYRSLLAFRNLENRHHGRSVQATGWLQILIHLYWHIHQVDRSYASSEHHARCNSQVLAEYHIQVQCTHVGPHR